MLQTTPSLTATTSLPRRSNKSNKSQRIIRAQSDYRQLLVALAPLIAMITLSALIFGFGGRGGYTNNMNVYDGDVEKPVVRKINIVKSFVLKHPDQLKQVAHK